MQLPFDKYGSGLRKIPIMKSSIEGLREMIMRVPTLATLFLLLSFHSWGNLAHPNDSSKTRQQKTPIVIPQSPVETRYFEQLHIPIDQNDADPIVIPQQIFSDSTEHYRAKALEYQVQVLQRNVFINNLSDIALLELPVGLSRDGGDLNYSIILSKVRLTPIAAFIEAYFIFELPQTGDKIAFRGANIKFTYDGGFSGDGKLELIGNYPIKLNDKTLLTILGNGNTYVEFSCDGFKQMGISADVEFSRDLLIPENEKGEIIAAPARVKTNFSIQAQHWNDILVTVSLPPFRVNGLKDFGFTVSEVSMDWSDFVNPPGLVFPEGYSSTFIQSGQPSLWQGFFLKEIEVRLPASFAKRNNTNRVAFGCENMIIDDLGFTGTLFAENIIQAGDMSGWSYTLDRVGVELVSNRVRGFELAGTISVPRLKAKDKETATHFGYLAQRSADGDYIFAVTVENNLRLPFLMADVNLYHGSSIIVKEKNGKFYPSATLNGDLSIKGIGKGVKANFTQVRFEGMKISSEEPHFDIQTLSFGGNEGQSISKFPVVISAIALKKEPNKIGLAFDLTINIGGKDTEEGFGGTASLTVWGKKEPVKNSEGVTTGSASGDYEFDKVEISGVKVNIKKEGAYQLTGSIHFFDGDPVYGDGFRGHLTGSISKFGGISATALFGRTEKFRYWYADALVKLKSGVPVIPGVLFASAFGGGFYSKMKQTDKSPGSTLGKTASEVYYVPDENFLGIRAIMDIQTLRPEAMNGQVGLEVAMNRHGGINSVTLTGNANFMSLAELTEGKIKELASSAATGKLAEKLAGLTKGQVTGNMKLLFDNENDVFHGNLEIFVNVAGGLLRGVGSNSRAGWAVLHFEKSDWHVLIGTPTDPIGLEVAKIFKAKSYFMLGKNLPGSPPPPSQVTEILGNVDLDYMRDMNALQSGMGFAFGLHFIVDTGDLRFLMFYGRFAAGTGVDFMLKDYGTEYHCAGSSGPMGINGWYANGQAYAFVLGKIGIKVNLKFYKGNYDILSIGAAAILQAKGPNPFWMKGIVGGYYKILGGMVKGRCKFEVTVGKDCKPVGEQNLLEDVNMIAEISPAKGSSDVDVFNAPQVAFNIPVDEVFEITDLENKRHAFRAKLDQFDLFSGSEKIAGTLQWNLEKDVVIFDGRDILPGEKKLKAVATLTFEELINGTWTKVKFDGRVVEEKAETLFTTRKAPDYIPSGNVSLSYPIAGQVNFYPKEYGRGFIQLKDGQPYLFKPSPEWIQKIRFTNAVTQSYVECNLTYDDTEKKVNFTIPDGMVNSAIYNFEILNIPRQATIIDGNVQKVEKDLVTSSTVNTSTAVLTIKDVQGHLDRLEVKSFYTSNFRTSKYNTFIEKMKNVKLSNTLRMDLDVNVYRLFAYLHGDEIFDKAEIDNITRSGNLIQMTAVLEGNNWYENYAYPLVYEGYPLLGTFKIKTRLNPDLFGIPPVRDVYSTNYSQSILLREGETSFTPVAFTSEYISYNLGESVDIDFRDLQLQAANYVASNPSNITPRLSELILKPTPRLRYGTYLLKVNYVIPGTNQISSTVEYQLFNSIPDND
jgi:hypothetical protein